MNRFGNLILIIFCTSIYRQTHSMTLIEWTDPWFWHLCSVKFRIHDLMNSNYHGKTFNLNYNIFLHFAETKFFFSFWEFQLIRETVINALIRKSNMFFFFLSLFKEIASLDSHRGWWVIEWGKWMDSSAASTIRRKKKKINNNEEVIICVCITNVIRGCNDKWFLNGPLLLWVWMMTLFFFKLRYHCIFNGWTNSISNLKFSSRSIVNVNNTKKNCMCTLTHVDFSE